MDSEDQAGGPERHEGKAVMISPQAEADAASVRGDAERNDVFNNLVREDSDIVGLVAYSIYKQNKVDWLAAFEKALGRTPSNAELNAYILGESTPRRLGIYRQLAAATLTGTASEAGSEANWHGGSAAQSKSGQSWLLSSVLSYAVLAAAILLGIWIVARYALPAAHT